VRGLFIGLVAALALCCLSRHRQTVSAGQRHVSGEAVVQPLGRQGLYRARVRSACCTKADARSRTALPEGTDSAVG